MDFDWLEALSFSGSDPVDLMAWAIEKGCLRDLQIQYIIQQLEPGLPALSTVDPIQICQQNAGLEMGEPSGLQRNPTLEREEAELLQGILSEIDAIETQSSQPQFSAISSDVTSDSPQEHKSKYFHCKQCNSKFLTKKK